MYEVILTQSEIQDGLNLVNVEVAKEIAEAKCKLLLCNSATPAL